MRHHDDLAELLDYLDPETFLDYEGVSYRRTFGSSGAQLNIQECPRCGGREWKVYLNSETGLGNCFHGACVGEAGYNLYSFALALWGLTPAETIERLRVIAREQGWMARREPVVSVSAAEVKLPASVALPYKEVMPRYLTERGVDASLARYFHLRYCKEGYFNYRDHGGELHQQNYSGRVIIPVFNLDGELVTFQGRDITGTAEKKYLFPAGLPGTARFLYNGHNAIGAEQLVICEGAFDVIAVRRAFDDDMALRAVAAVGSFGKHFSHGSNDGDDQLGALHRLKEAGLRRVVIMWDGEAAALRDAIDAAKQIRSIGLAVRIAVLPPDLDPDEATPAQVRQAFYQSLAPTSAKLMRAILTRR